nr:hypothetical protein [Tanacetum cinerariifolium]
MSQPPNEPTPGYFTHLLNSNPQQYSSSSNPSNPSTPVPQAKEPREAKCKQKRKGKQSVVDLDEDDEDDEIESRRSITHWNNNEEILLSEASRRQKKGPKKKKSVEKTSAGGSIGGSTVGSQLESVSSLVSQDYRRKCDAAEKAYEAKREKELAIMQCKELGFLMIDPSTLSPAKRAIIERKQAEIAMEFADDEVFGLDEEEELGFRTAEIALKKALVNVTADCEEKVSNALFDMWIRQAKAEDDHPHEGLIWLLCRRLVLVGFAVAVVVVSGIDEWGWRRRWLVVEAMLGNGGGLMVGRVGDGDGGSDVANKKGMIWLLCRRLVLVGFAVAAVVVSGIGEWGWRRRWLVVEAMLGNGGGLMVGRVGDGNGGSDGD